MRTQHIIYTFALAALTLFSCVKEPAELPEGGIGDGTATRITLAIKSDSRPSVGQRGAASQANPAVSISRTLPGTRSLTQVQEELIDNVHILVFDATGAIAANEHFDNVSISGTGNVSFESLPGEGMQIFVVANGDVNDHKGTTLDKKLKSITTLDQLSAILVEVDGDGLSRTDRLMMVGTATATITKPHKVAIPVELHFLDTKVTLTVKDNIPATEAITITGWDIVNIPKKSYLKERTAPAQEDAVNGSTPSDYTATNGKYPFGSVDAATKTWAHTIYLFENRRGGRVERADPINPTDKYPGMSITDNDQRGKAWYAPAGATCMLIYGTYTKDGQMNNVVYKVFLGENPVDDYNLFRGKHYNYNVTINGLTNINVDTNVEWGSASFSVDHSDNLMMDAHPDFRVFRIAGTAVDASTPAYATVELLEADGVTPCQWLAVSPLNLYRHAIKQSGNADQQFAPGNGIYSFVRTKYNSVVSSETEFPSATFAMTRKLTKIPFVQPAIYTYQNAIIYADGYDGTGQRTAKVRITYYKGVNGTEKAGEQTFDITQSGAIRVSDDLYIERYEESAMLMHPGLASGLQNTATMQWGYNTSTLYAADDRFSNGNYLTANAIYKTVATRNAMNTPTWTATTYADYREKYPRTGAKVTEPSTLTTTEEPYFYPELTSATQPSEYFHPIFNSSAARYCHEKNRDKDGDGIISAAETQWYLPSFADMWYISQNMPSELSLTGNYWTATEENNTNSWGYTFPAKTGASASKTAAYRVRCVKGNGIVLPDATIQSNEADKTKINLVATAGASGAFTVTDATGLSWTVASSDASWLKVATSAAGAAAAATAPGTGDKTLYAYATANTSTTAARTATITLIRPGLPATPAQTITVTQAKTPPASTVTPTSITLNFFAGESATFAIDNKDIGWEWTVTSSDASWLQIATDGMGAGATTSKTGTANTTLYAYAKTANTSTTKERTAKITLSRLGMSNITINVTQTKNGPYTPPPHKGWAGCNVYWEPYYVNTDGTKGRLTFDDVGVTTHNNIQGVYFLWGSLVAISPMGVYNTSTSILFSPTGVKNYAYTSIPRATNNIPANRAEDYLITMHNPTAGIGDICRYITARGWASGTASGKRWRMPVSNEFEAAGNYSKFGTFAVVSSTNANGTTVIPSGYTRSTAVNFPNAGRRKGDSSLEGVGTRSRLWSCTPKSGESYLFGGETTFLNPAYTDLSSLGAPVRCVVD